jgi:hypothetical protein
MGFNGDDLMSCPKCSRLFNAKELARILEEAGVSEKTTNIVRKELTNKEVADAIEILHEFGK